MPLTTLSEGSIDCDACEKGTYMDQEGTCRGCPEGVRCEEAEKLETLELKPGYFRATPESTKVYPCTMGEAACQGGNQSGDKLCSEGYDGA